MHRATTAISDAWAAMQAVLITKHIAIAGNQKITNERLNARLTTR